MRSFKNWLNSYWGHRFLWLFPLLPLVWLTDLTPLLWIGFTLLTLAIVKSARDTTFKLVYQNVPVSVLIGVLVGCGVSFLMDPWLIPFAEELSGTQINLSQLEGLPGNRSVYIEWLIVSIGVGGIWEEIAFRGFFIGWGVLLFGVRWAIPLVILVSVVFGYGHIYQDLPGAIVAGAGGFVFGLTYVFCKCRLLPAIMAHSVANAIAITKIYLQGF